MSDNPVELQRNLDFSNPRNVTEDEFFAVINTKPAWTKKQIKEVWDQIKEDKNPPFTGEVKCGPMTLKFKDGRLMLEGSSVQDGYESNLKFIIIPVAPMENTSAGLETPPTSAIPPIRSSLQGPVRR